MHVDLTYDRLTRHIVPGPRSLTYFIPLLLLPLALLVPNTILSRWQRIAIFMPIIGYSTADAWRHMSGVDVITVDVLLWCLFFLVLRDPWKEFQFVAKDSTEPNSLITSTKQHQPITNDIRVTPYPPDLTERVRWVLNLLVSLRLNNWRIGRPSHDRLQPPSSQMTKTSFVTKSMLNLIRGFIVLDLARAFVENDSYFTNLDVSITSPFPKLPKAGPLFCYTLRSVAVGSHAWALISQFMYLPTLLPVGLNALGLLPNEWSPHTWPPHFGTLEDAFMHGIRGFWGRYWHQTMRYMASEPGYAIADGLRLRSGLVRYTIIVGTTFLLTGVVHAGMVPPEPLNTTMDVNYIRLLVAGFFWLQPVAMTAEVIFLRLFGLRTNGLRKGWKMFLNAVWMFVWSLVCLPLLGEAGRQLGYFNYPPLPISLWHGLRGEGWNTWLALI